MCAELLGVEGSHSSVIRTLLYDYRNEPTVYGSLTVGAATNELAELRGQVHNSLLLIQPLSVTHCRLPLSIPGSLIQEPVTRL